MHILGSARQLNKAVEFKQHYFEGLHALSNDEQKTLLTRVVKKELSILEMMTEAKGIKSMNTLRDMFTRYVHKNL